MRSLLRPALGFAGLAIAACSSPPRPRHRAITQASSQRLRHQRAPTRTRRKTSSSCWCTRPGRRHRQPCSGSLIAPNLVLTARHCVSDTDQQGFACDADGNTSSAAARSARISRPRRSASTTARPAPPTSAGTRAGRDRRRDLTTTTPTNLCNHDLALVLLDRRSPARRDRADPPRLAAHVDKAHRPPSAGARHRTDRIRARGSSAPTSRSATWGRYPGDGTPSRSRPTTSSSASPSAAGDSGGPSSPRRPTPFSASCREAATARYDPQQPAAGTCIGAGNYYTRVDGFSRRHPAAYADAGQDPWLEGGPDPRLAKFGAPCSADADCRSNACLPSDATCTQDCCRPTPAPRATTAPRSTRGSSAPRT